MLRLVSEVFNMALEPPNGQSQVVDDNNLLTILEWKIRSIPVRDDPLPSEMIAEESRALELFQLALLVYLKRVSGSSLRQSEKMQSMLNRAFTIFSQIKTCQRYFPLVIIGCEATTEHDRIVVLDLISRTEKYSYTRSLQHMKAIIQSLWAQDDLSGGVLGYKDKIKAVLSSSETLPSFI